MSDQTRRDLMRLASVGLAVGVAPRVSRSQSTAQSEPGTITARVTAGTKRYAEAPSIDWQPERGSPGEAIILDPRQQYQEVLGFGAAFTDASCYMFNQMAPDARKKLFRELFHPSEMGLSVGRVCMGSSDYSTKVYSYDEGEADPELKRFSIEHDHAYILPMLKEAMGENPDLFLLGTPWSPPGWMKGIKSMLGGCMPKKYFASYANYFVKFVQSYREAGVPVKAVSVQNEVDTNQDGSMPACQWGQEYEVQFVGQHLGPQFEKNQIDTKIWLIDHNYNLWGRAIAELDDPLVEKYADGIAWHGYLGSPSEMTRVHDAHPNKNAYWTEGGPAYNSPTYQTEWARWSTTYTGILRNWARCIIGWNLALDEVGKPNIGPFDCGGMVTIDSKTKEVTRSGQYWAFAHYSRAIRRGAKRIESLGGSGEVTHAVFANPEGTYVAVLTNPGPATKSTLRMAGKEATISLPGDSIMTLLWKA